MRLAFYSDQIIPQNRAVDAALLEILPRGAKVGFVPSAGDPTGRWATERRAYYDAAGLRLAHSHDPAADGPDSLKRLLECDAIHLSGGDTIEFQRRLSGSGMLAVLRNYALAGGVLIGASAGAILLTPTIRVDALFGSDVPDETLGLGLVDFEFFPHLDDRLEYRTALASYSETNSRPIFGCPNGSGVIVDGDRVVFVGPGVVAAEGHLNDWLGKASRTPGKRV